MENQSKHIRKTPITEVKLNELYKKAQKDVKDAGIEYGNLKGMVKVNKKANSFWGRCTAIKDKKNNINYSQIEVSQNLLFAEDIDILNTLVHEILHSCKDCQNHGAVWQSYANTMNRKYGYNVKTKTSDKEKGLQDRTIENAKYIIKCPSCGMTVCKNRICTIVNYPERYRCNKCKVPLKRIK